MFFENWLPSDVRLLVLAVAILYAIKTTAVWFVFKHRGCPGGWYWFSRHRRGLYCRKCGQRNPLDIELTDQI